MRLTRATRSLFVLCLLLTLTGITCSYPNGHVMITSPAQGTTFTKAEAVTITVSVDAELDVDSVRVFDGGNSLLICKDDSAPYTCSWSITSELDGPHKLVAAAYSDVDGNPLLRSVAIADVTVAIEAGTEEAARPGEVIWEGELPVRFVDSDPAGNVYGANRVIAPGYPTILRKLSSEGTLVWEKQIGMPEPGRFTQAANFVRSPTDDLVLVAGGSYVPFTLGGATLEAGGFVLGFDGDGVFTQSVILTGTQGIPGIQRVEYQPDGSLYVVGFPGSFFGQATMDFGEGDVDMSGVPSFVAKYSPTGEYLWHTSLTRQVTDTAINSLGELVVLHSSVHGEPGHPGFAILHVNNDGQVVSEVTVGEDAQLQSAKSIDVDAEDNLVIGGRFTGELRVGSQSIRSMIDVWNSRDQHYNGFVIKLTRAGQPVWLRGLPSTELSTVHSVAVAPDNSIAIGGLYHLNMDLLGIEMPSVNGPVHKFTAKLSPGGALVWHYHGGSTTSSASIPVVVTPDGAVIGAGAKVN